MFLLNNTNGLSETAINIAQNQIKKKFREKLWDEWTTEPLYGM